MDEQTVRFIEKKRIPLFPTLFGIYLKSNRYIGNIKLEGNDIGIMIGEKDCWGKGYAPEAIKLLTDHFLQSGLTHILAGVNYKNKSARKAFKKAGYKIWKEFYIAQHPSQPIQHT